MKTVLFVCVHNAGRSQMAEALFNQLSNGQARALSAGTKPSDKVNPTVVQAMGEIGIDISQHKPKALTMEMVEQSDRVITMGCGSIEEACPGAVVEAEDWKIEDPQWKSLDDIRKIRDEIKARVIKLLEEMASEKKT
ncbi:MAG: arsenate reductase ArsC [Chloroflexi bacterium]|nr:arsenate reductase ArsC [Chloroflexota bacterium]